MKLNSHAKAFLAGFLVVLVIIGVVVGGYLGGWWLNKDVVNRTAKVQRASYNEQQTYRAEIVKTIGQVREIDVELVQTPDQASTLNASRKAFVNIICKDDSYIQGGLDDTSAAFVAKECA